MFCLLTILSISAAKVQTVSEGTNYTAVNIGKFSDLSQYELKKPDGKVMCTGKVFIGNDAKMTGSEISYTTLPPGGQSPFFHVHHIHEESYLVISGSGEFQIEDNVFPIEEGSVVRVGTGVSRGIKNTGKVPLVYLCIQTTENSFKAHIPDEAEITQTPPKFTVSDEV
ncbi:hypothetical protein M9Y10_028801 [Tritrichomonas musculus]|uniref:Cupin type-2 domain-containing protein n=1 Tax=Tritrichomonas musculus TaxID=1915356 RepID=A0ABR2KLA2_9EUKA